MSYKLFLRLRNRLRQPPSIRRRWLCLLLLERLERLGFPDRIFLPLCGWFWLLFGYVDETLHDFLDSRRRFSLPMGFSTWCNYRKLSGVAHGCIFRYRLWIRGKERPQVEVEGERLLENAKTLGRGVLVLTYHHHFNATFCAFMGRLFGPLWVFARDPKVSPAYPALERFAKRMYSGSEDFFRGGRYLFVDGGNSIILREAISAFKHNALVVSVHDFPVSKSPFMSGFFLNPKLTYPTGAIDYALRNGVPILFGYLDWQGGDRFRLSILPCVSVSDTRAVLTNYFSVIEHRFFQKPESWEYWRTLK